MVGHLVDPGSMFAFLAAHRGELFPDEMFADLFASVKGASSIPGSVMASVMTLQTLHDYSDREAAEAVRCDLRWKVACGGGIGGRWAPRSWLTRLRPRTPSPELIAAVRRVARVVPGAADLVSRVCVEGVHRPDTSQEGVQQPPESPDPAIHPANPNQGSSHTQTPIRRPPRKPPHSAAS
jgi:hypothetical protein